MTSDPIVEAVRAGCCAGRSPQHKCKYPVCCEPGGPALCGHQGSTARVAVETYAALNAQRGRLLEPTKAMCDAGSMAVIDEGAPDFPGAPIMQTISARLNPREAATVWRAMVRAIRQPASGEEG